MDTESSSAMNGKASSRGGSNKRKSRNSCIGVIAAILGIIILIVILAFTVFKAKQPITTINSVALNDLHASFDVARLRVNLNLSLDVNLSVKNPNKVGFKHTNGSAFLNYRGQQVGEATVPAGQIPADGTESMNLTLAIMADRLLYNSSTYSDIAAGELPLNTYTSLPGKVNILKIFKIHVVSSASCDFTVFISNRSVSEQQCTYKTKL